MTNPQTTTQNVAGGQAAPAKTLHWSTVSDTYDNITKPHSGTVADLYATLEAWQRRSSQSSAKGGVAIIGARFTVGPHTGKNAADYPGEQRWRLLTRVQDCTLLMLDIDGATCSVEAARSPWADVCRIDWSTHSHGVPSKPGLRMRLLMPYARHVSDQEHRVIYAWAVERMAAAGVDKMDLGTKDPTRLMYGPGSVSRESLREPWLCFADGPLLDPDNLPGGGSAGELLAAIDAAKEAKEAAREAERVEREREAQRRIAERGVREAFTKAEDESGLICPTAQLYLPDLDPKRVLAWADRIANKLVSDIATSTAGDRHYTARDAALFFGNVLAGLDELGACLSAEAKERVSWASEVSGIEGRVRDMEAEAVSVGDNDPTRARAVQWGVDQGRAQPHLPDYRLKKQFRPSEKAKGGKVIQMKRKGGGLPAYEEQPAIPPRDEDEDSIETNEDGEPIEETKGEATEPGKPKPFRLFYERKLDTCTKGPDYRVWTEDEWEQWATAWNKRPPFWCQTWREHVDSLGWWRLPSETELADRACLALTDGADSPGPVSDEGALWRFDVGEGIWVEVDEDAFHRVVMRWDGQLADDPAPKKNGPRIQFVCVGKRSCDSAYAQALRTCAAPGFFAEAPHGFAVRDSFMRVDFAKKEIVEEPLSHTHRARFRMDVDLASTPPSPLLDKYRDTVHAGAFDWKERLQVMAELGFVALTGTGPQFERGAMLNGEGGSGKSQFLNMVEQLIPKRARCAIPPHELGGDYEKASLAGKTLNIYADAESSDIIREGAIKMIMHGETIKARNPYGRVFDLKPRALHLFSCNDWPAAPGVSNAFWDRWVAIRFERRFRDTEAVVKDIGRTIALTETAALVKWFLDAGRELLKAGRYTIPSSTIALMGEWRAEGDSVAAWRAAATEYCNHPEPKHWMSATAAYADYKMWCDTNGFRGVVNSTNFGKRLKTAGVEHVRKTAGIFYRLLKVTPPEDEDERSPF